MILLHIHVLYITSEKLDDTESLSLMVLGLYIWPTMQSREANYSLQSGIAFKNSSADFTHTDKQFTV